MAKTHKKEHRNHVITETLEHSEAFEYYYSLGEARSLQAVSKFNGKAFVTIKRWSAAFRWQERVKVRDAEIAARMAEKTAQSVLVSKTRYREAIATLIEKFEEDIRDGKIKIRNVVDFEKIVKLDLELMGDGFNDDDGNNNIKSLAAVLEQSAKLLTGAIATDIVGDGTEQLEE